MGGVILRNLILGLTMLSCGFVVWLAVGNIRAAVSYRDAGSAFYAMARLGLVLVIGLVAEAVLKQPEIEVNVRSALYVFALMMVTVGYAGVLVYERRRPRRRADYT